MRRLSLMLLAVAAIGCGSSTEPLSLGSTDANIVGSFGLQLAAGKTLPLFVGVTSTQEVNLVADTLVIAKDNTWSEATLYLLTAFADGTVVTSKGLSTGTYTVTNGQINFTMVSPSSVTFSGSVTGNMLSLIYNGSRYVYGR